MQLHLTPDQEARLSQLASYAGTDPEHLVMDAALHLLEEDRLFREGIERGLAAADRGEFVDSRDLWASIEKILQS